VAKLKSPLLSFSAHGTLGDVLVFFNRHGKSYVRSKPQDPISLSVAQSVLRDCFASAAVSAHSLTEGQKDFYADLAPDSAFCPWYNNFIGRYIQDNYEGPDVAKTFLKSLNVVTGTIPDGEAYVDVEVPTIVTVDCAPFLLGCAPVNTDPRNFVHYIGFLDSTHVRFVRSTTSKLGDLIISAMVIQFDPDFIVSTQNCSISFASGDTTKTFSIDAVDLDKAIIFPRGALCNDNVTPNKYNWYADFLNNTTVRIRRSAAGSSGFIILLVNEFI